MASQKYDEYNSEPVVYCSTCYSLKIGNLEGLGDYCMDCGSTDIKETSIEEWETMYERRYGKKYAIKTNNLRNSPVFSLSPSKLKSLLFESSSFDDIAKELYPNISQGLTKFEKVMWLYDKASSEGKLDDLRFIIIKYLRNKE